MFFGVLVFTFIVTITIFLIVLLAFALPKSMRSKFEFETKENPQLILPKIAEVINVLGYHAFNYAQEKVFVKGDGVITSRKFINLLYTDNSIIIEAWIGNGFGNGKGKEYPLDVKFIGLIPKRVLKKDIAFLSNFIKKEIENNNL